jgi:hypothetical protein
MKLPPLLIKVANTIILSFSFISYLIWNIIEQGFNWSLFGLIWLAIFGLAVSLFSIFNPDEPPKKEEEPPAITTAPVSETAFLEELANVMIDYHLELRIRRAEDGWNVTLLSHQGGVVRMVGMGTSKIIIDALVKAEADFLEKSA